MKLSFIKILEELLKYLWMSSKLTGIKYELVGPTVVVLRFQIKDDWFIIINKPIGSVISYFISYFCVDVRVERGINHEKFLFSERRCCTTPPRTHVPEIEYVWTHEAYAAPSFSTTPTEPIGLTSISSLD